MHDIVGLPEAIGSLYSALGDAERYAGQARLAASRDPDQAPVVAVLEELEPLLQDAASRATALNEAHGPGAHHEE